MLFGIHCFEISLYSKCSKLKENKNIQNLNSNDEVWLGSISCKLNARRQQLSKSRDWLFLPRQKIESNQTGGWLDILILVDRQKQIKSSTEDDWLVQK